MRTVLKGGGVTTNMKNYSYVAKDSTGKTLKGVMEAEDEQQVQEKSLRTRLVPDFYHRSARRNKNEHIQVQNKRSCVFVPSACRYAYIGSYDS